MSIYLYAFLSVAVVSIISLVGVISLILKMRKLRSYLYLLVSLAAGALIGDAFFHLIPESLAGSSSEATVSAAIIAGILVFFIFEKVLHWHHHQTVANAEEAVHPIGHMVLFSDGIHNLIDGLIIGASYMVSIEIGIATTLAIILHEIPQEIGDFGVLLEAGYSTKRALLVNFFSALLALVGAGIALLIGTTANSVVFWLVPFAAGGFIYIALTDLFPHLHTTKQTYRSVLQLVMMLVGIGVMALFLLLE